MSWRGGLAVAPPAWSSGTLSHPSLPPLLPDLQEKISWLLAQRKDLTIQVQELQRQNQDLQNQVPPGTPTGTPPRAESFFITRLLPLLPWPLLILVAPCRAQDRFWGGKTPPPQPLAVSLMSRGWAGWAQRDLPAEPGAERGLVRLQLEMGQGERQRLRAALGTSQRALKSFKKGELGAGSPWPRPLLISLRPSELAKEQLAASQCHQRRPVW